MRIGFDAKRIFLNQRGLGSYGRNLVQGLLRYHTEPSYYLYTPKVTSRPGYNLKKDNLTIRTPGSGFPSVLGGLWRCFLVSRCINDDQLDIYHGLSQEIPFKVPSRLTKLVVTVHDLIFLKYPDFFSSINRNIYKKKISYACRHAHLVIAISEQTKSDLVTLLNVPENKVKVVYQSCDEIYYQQNSPGTGLVSINNFQLPPKFILYVGALVPHKNVLAIVKAMRLMKEKHCPLLIVGQGKKYQRQLVEFIQSSNLTDRVIFLSNHGPISNQQLALIYRSASLFVFPSLMEGFGIPIIEAMFSGVPVIANQQAGLSEATGGAALEIDVNHSELLAESMDQILTDEQSSESMVRNGISNVQRFRLDRLTKQMMDCYLQLLD
jgi:glycosyltransferase involved in cell wall biosynthesis